MDLIRKTNGWSCILEAFAMALDATTDDLIREIGHNGGQIINAALPEPQGRRGFHVQELVRVAYLRGRKVTPIELVPSSRYSDGSVLKLDSESRKSDFMDLVCTRRGVITGMSTKTAHAVAFDHGKVYDSAGYVYTFSFAACEARGFYAQCLWIVE